MTTIAVEYASISYDGCYVASSPTGPMNWQPDITLQWPDSGNTLSWQLDKGSVWDKGNPDQDKAGISGDPFVDIRKQLAQSMAEYTERIIMGGTKKEKKMPKNNERTVYNIFVIDPEDDGKVIAKLENVIAKNPEAAKLKAVLQLAENEDKLKKDLEDYDLLVEDVADFGSIRPK